MGYVEGYWRPRSSDNCLTEEYSDHSGIVHIMFARLKAYSCVNTAEKSGQGF